MPVFYVLTGVVSGFIAALSSLAMGHPLIFALLAYSFVGGLWTLAIAIAIGVMRKGYPA